MATFRRRIVLATIAGVFVALAIFATTRPEGVPVAQAQANEVETFLSEGQPTKLYTGDSSHVAPADANPAGGRTGYCVQPTTAGTTANLSAGPNGFTVVNGTVESTDYFDGGTPNTLDDFYCVVVVAGPVVPTDPDDLLNGVMQVRWNWVNSANSTQGLAELTLAVFRIELLTADIFVNGVAEVCTSNWDPNVLTGAASNRDPFGIFPDPLGPLPDPQDDVRLGADADDATGLDWIVQAPFVGPTYEKLIQFRKEQEWCMNFTTPDEEQFEITLFFDAIYRTATNVDDQAHSVSVIADFEPAPVAQLRHITPGGAVTSEQISGVNVVGSRHSVCLIPTGMADNLSANGVYITGGNVSGLVVYRNAGRFAGVPDATWCFSWTSSTPGNQFVQASYTDSLGDPQTTTWNIGDDEEPTFQLLVKRWGIIEKTEITTGNDPTQGIITGGTISRNIQFNIADGTYAAGTIGLTEWVFGLTGPEADIPAFLDGVYLEVDLLGTCGYFLTPFFDDLGGATNIDGQPRSMSGRSVSGRFDLDPTSIGIAEPADGLPDDITISITNDGGCSPASNIRIEIRAYYPDTGDSGPGTQFPGVETANITFNFVPAQSAPRVAWAGEVITLTFAFGGGCEPFDDATIVFLRPDEQPGTFLPGPGITLNGPGEAIGTFSDEETDQNPACSFSVRYESEDPGEIDIQVLFTNAPNAPNFRPEFIRVHIPVFYMVLEDVTITADENLPVSARGQLNAQVRGWFPGSNPSGREAVTFEDGRAAPQDRWVLPDDWSLLRGDSEFRTSWPGSAPIPPTYVTFLMENEGLRNVYPNGETEGGLGWFLPDGGESSFNVNPRSGQPSILGSPLRPRIMTDLTTTGGRASVGTVGDLNLSFEGCPPNRLTGNPHCGIDNPVGSTTYYAVADYPENRGKWMPAVSNTATTDWRWLGYKEVTIVDTDVPSMKYVVAHLKDRDGFCDAYFYHNVLGVKVEFQIDSDEGGRIFEAADRPFEIELNFKAATATTFDTHDAFGRPINVEIAKPVILDDECQAWVKITNSLLGRTNVVVTFPGQQEPLPGEVRLTGLVCGVPGSATVTNAGDVPVSLAGFGLRSLGRDIVQPEEHLDLIGYLAPGESKTFSGAETLDTPWQFLAGPAAFTEGPSDYARLVWNEVEVSRLDCSGNSFQPSFPRDIPLEREGEIMIDVIVDFAPGQDQPLVLGWNLVSVSSNAGPLPGAFGADADRVQAVYRFDGSTARWDRYFANEPGYLNSFEALEAGGVYWVLVK